MKKLIFIIVFFSILFFILACIGGCAGQCIKIGGTYKDYTGELEYCFSKFETKKEGVPVLITKEGDKIFAFDLKDITDINKIIDEIKNKFQVKGKEKTQVQILLDRLKEYRKGK